MNILVLGSGGREHAIVWKLSQSDKVENIYAIPGNPGIGELAKNVNIELDAHREIADFSKEKEIELVIIGPEKPLVEGIADILRKEGIKVFGPGRIGAELEGSKIFSKKFMQKHGILTPKFNIYDNKEDAIERLDNLEFPLVIKVDGLAGGKGVLIPKSYKEAVKDLEMIFDKNKFGSAGDKILVEEFVTGYEASILCLVDKNNIVPLESARDYKKAFDNDLGLNTGGMGAVSPNDKLSSDMFEIIKRDVLEKTLIGLKKDEIEFNGVLFIGLMITDENKPYVLEYNVRFGDPETQSILPRLENDIIELFMKTVDNELDDINLLFKKDLSITVVLASGGYPEKYDKGLEIEFDNIDNDVIVFHAGTKNVGDKLVTNGGRVFGVTSVGNDKEKLRKKLYDNIDRIKYKNKIFRKDIGL